MLAGPIAIAIYSEHLHLQAELPTTGSISYVPSLGFELSDTWCVPEKFQLRKTGSEGVDVWNGKEVRHYSVSDVFRLGEGWCCLQPQLDVSLVQSQSTKITKTASRKDPRCRSSRPPSLATLERWFETLGNIQRQPNDSEELFHAVAAAMIDSGGLDSALVLKRQSSDWRIVASVVPSLPVGIGYQLAVAEEACRTKELLVVSADATKLGTTLIAVPFLDAQDEVAGILYGVRATTETNQRQHFRPLEIKWTQILAETVTAGLIRFEAEQREAQARYIFGRSFSPSVVTALIDDPDLLTPRESAVSILFADLQDFTPLSEQLGSKLSYELLAEVMNCLTEQIMLCDGVVLDYYGDGLAAMWNAPLEQPRYVELACRAAQQMQQQMRQVSQEWRGLTNRSMKLSISVASGQALVGNAGSDQRLKYGPRGTTVHLASRLESASKKLDIAILVCDQTRQQLRDASLTREIGTFALPGISEPQLVHELIVDDVIKQPGSNDALEKPKESQELTPGFS